MVSNQETSEARLASFGGASFGRTNDQTLRFLKDGMWETGNRPVSYKAMEWELNAFDLCPRRKSSSPSEKQGW